MSRVKTRAAALCLAGTCLFSSCAPVIRPNLQVPVLTGNAYAAAQKLPFEQLEASTPAEVALTFTSCQGGAVKAGDVRQVGPQLAQESCLRAVRYEQQQQTYWRWQVVAIPISLGLTYWATRSVGCALFKSLGAC